MANRPVVELYGEMNIVKSFIEQLWKLQSVAAVETLILSSRLRKDLSPESL